MKTRISNAGNCTIVEVSGYLDFETAKPFTQSIEDIYKDDSKVQLIIDLSNLEFVGSSGISNFVKGLRTFNKLNLKPRYCGVKNEFKKLFRLFEENSDFHFCESRSEALKIANQKSHGPRIDSF
ncbi:STAS domain-containing protein [bacterium]|nr:STAS domain-containing protein [bacterium]